MNEIKKYTLKTLKSGLFNIADHAFINERTEFVKYSDVEQLQARIKELESVNRVNEIKANAIIEAINCDMDYVNDYPIPRNYEYGMVLLRLNTFAGKLRNNNE